MTSSPSNSIKSVLLFIDYSCAKMVKNLRGTMMSRISDCGQGINQSGHGDFKIPFHNVQEEGISLKKARGRTLARARHFVAHK